MKTILALAIASLLSLQATADQGQFLVYWPDTNPPHAVPDSGSSALLLLIGIAALAMGCTKTKIDRRADGSWSINRSSLFQKLEIPGATVATNGTWTLKGYSNDGGAASLEGIARGAAEGAAKGAK